MISAFQIFKIIFGIILSAFVLVMILRFSISLTEVGEAGTTAGVLFDLGKTIQNVYTTGICTDFTIHDAEKTIKFYSPPNVISDLGSLSLEPIPTFLIPSKDILACRGLYDLDWWDFQFVLVIPETNIVFVPLNNTDVVWNTIGNITLLLPSTQNLNSRITFTFGCNGTSFPDTKWDRDYFLSVALGYLPVYLTDRGLVLNPCEKEHLPPGYRAITVSENPVDSDFVVVPSDNEMGYVYINSTTGVEKYLYKTPLDIIALFLGGKESYHYANRVFLKELGVSANLKIRETNLLMGRTGSECPSFYSSFLQSLNYLRETMNKNYTDEIDMMEFRDWLKETRKRHRLVEAVGC